MVAIRCEQISKSYDGLPVLQNFDFVLCAGERVALTGPSGRGKTTLARLLMGLEAPDAGTITGGAALRFCPVFQEDRLVPALSAVGNVGLVLLRAAFSGIAGALAALGLGEEDIHKPVAELSGGQRRRVALARALLAPGDVVVLDEAFKGLDDETRAAAYRFVQAHLGGRALLLITHDAADVAALCTRKVELPVVAAAAKGAVAPPV